MINSKVSLKPFSKACSFQTRRLKGFLFFDNSIIESVLQSLFIPMVYQDAFSDIKQGEILPVIPEHFQKLFPEEISEEYPEE